MLLQKGWGFRVRTWNVDTLTGRTCEVVEALSDIKVDMACIKKHDGKVEVASFMELKAKDISCTRWEVMKTFICRGCVISVTGTGRTSVDIGGDAMQIWS